VLAVVARLNADVTEPLATGVTDVGFTVHVAFAGQPVTVSPTALLNPFVEVTVTVELPFPPCVSVTDVGLLDIEKSGTGAAFTVSATAVE
jgi:hypothetical protein